MISRRFRRKAPTTRRPRYGRRPNTVRALAKKVAVVAKHERMNHQSLQYSYSSSASITTNPQTFCITRPSGWSALFGGTTKQEDSQRTFVKNIGTRLHISLNNPVGDYVGSDVVNFSVFVFKIRDRGALGTYYDNSTGVVTWTSGITHSTAGTRTLMNLKMFRVMKRWDFTLGNNSAGMSSGTALANSYGVEKILSYTTKCNKMLYSPFGTWASLPSFPDPGDNVFYVIFSDGVYTTTAPFLGYSNIVGLRSLGQ